VAKNGKKNKLGLPQYQREYCLQKEGTHYFLHYVIKASDPISDEFLTEVAINAAQNQSRLYKTNWIAHVGMTYAEMAEQRRVLREQEGR